MATPVRGRRRRAAPPAPARAGHRADVRPRSKARPWTPGPPARTTTGAPACSTPTARSPRPTARPGRRRSPRTSTVHGQRRRTTAAGRRRSTLGGRRPRRADRGDDHDRRLADLRDRSAAPSAASSTGGSPDLEAELSGPRVSDSRRARARPATSARTAARRPCTSRPDAGRHLHDHGVPGGGRGRYRWLVLDRPVHRTDRRPRRRRACMWAISTVGRWVTSNRWRAKVTITCTTTEPRPRRRGDRDGRVDRATRPCRARTDAGGRAR